MYQGNWTCSGCGGTITELPFEPRQTSGLTCRPCYAKKQNDQPVAGAPKTSASDGDATQNNKTMHAGHWTCSGCGGDITEFVHPAVRNALAADGA